MRYRAITRDGTEIEPTSGIVPIMKETDSDRYAVVGTGFYITRYGLFMTAAHVLSELVDWKEQKIASSRSFVCHPAGNNEVHLRRIVAITISHSVDLAIGQADNYKHTFPDKPLVNVMTTLSAEVPPVGTELLTYAYPENEILDFSHPDRIRRIVADFYEGALLRNVVESDHPFIPYPHYETSIAIKSGASGGPVFCGGRAIGVNCRGWDFGECDDDRGNLSYVVRIKEVLDFGLPLEQLPERSWEYEQIPPDRRGGNLTVGELAKYGHVFFDPPLTI